MINAKSELQYHLVVGQLEVLEEKGLLLPEECAIAKQLAVEKYCPQAVWE